MNNIISKMLNKTINKEKLDLIIFVGQNWLYTYKRK